MKNNKILIIEVILSFFIIIIVSSLITVVCLKIKSESKDINNSSKSSIIITSILENINSRQYSKIEEYIDNLSVIGISKKFEENDLVITVDGSLFEGKFFGTEIPIGYTLEMRVHDLNEVFDIQKSINIILSCVSEMTEVSTIIQREIVDNCNKPEITDEYFEELQISLDEYEIIPIKYCYKTNSYVVTTTGDEEWYNYYSKDWAKVLVFPIYGEDLKNHFINSEGNIEKQINYNGYTLNLENYIYTWIPNFSMKDNISYFRYGNGKNSIKQELLYKDGEYLYLNTISDVVEDISEECNFNGIKGVWRKIDNENDVYVNTFNATKFGPINLY